RLTLKGEIYDPSKHDILFRSRVQGTRLDADNMIGVDVALGGAVIGDGEIGGLTRSDDGVGSLPIGDNKRVTFPIDGVAAGDGLVKSANQGSVRAFKGIGNFILMAESGDTVIEITYCISIGINSNPATGDMRSFARVM